MEKIDKNFDLVIDWNKAGATDFLEEAKELKFPKIRKVHIDWMDKLSNSGIIDWNLFLKHAAPPSTDALYLYGGDFMLIDSFKEGLESVLKTAIEQIYIFHFSFRESGLRTVLENCTQAKELVLRGCQIGDLRPGFKLDNTRTYNLETLDLYWTCRK